MVVKATNIGIFSIGKILDYHKKRYLCTAPALGNFVKIGDSTRCCDACPKRVTLVLTTALKRWEGVGCKG